jgi:PAS domain S-box-containing protein
LAHPELESRVAQRTAELAADNQRLREEIARRVEVEESLRRSEEQLQLGFDAGPMGIAVVRLDGTITRVNRRLCDILKYSPADLLGRRLSDFADADDNDADQEMSDQVVRGRLPSYTTERRMVCGRGEPIWVRSTSALVCDPEGRPNYLLAMCEDITPQKQAEDAVRRSERLASVGTLASGIAHEINNPIGAALLAAEAAMVLKDRPESRVQFEQSLNTVMRSVERCADIVRRVLVFSRGSSAQKRPTRLQEVVDQAHHLTSSIATAKHVTLTVNGDAELPELMLSPIEMQLALINLINNAVEASAPGGDVIVQAKRTGNTVQITVEDHGRGMTKGEVSRLFDPFYSTRHQEGAVGLGLSTSLGIVQQHGGRIEVKSSTGKGTTMTVVLPIDHSLTNTGPIED